jgi:membrane protein YqaA with SNARE-associated domain
MTDSTIELTTDAGQGPVLPDGIRLRRWFVLFVGVLLTTAAVLAVLLTRYPLAVESWSAFKLSVAEAHPAVKLLVFGIYLMLSCTFVAAVAMEKYAVTNELWSTVLIAGSVGALASTLANLNDYHLFLLLLRSHHVARVRHTRAYRLAARWFDRAPFVLVFLFNLLPIPVDVARMLAALHRYPRGRFFLANVTGRFLRYAVITYVTYRLADKGYIAVIVLLALAVVLGLGRVGLGIFFRRRGKGTCETCADECGPSSC